MTPEASSALRSATIVIPVNAQGDLDGVRHLLGDLAECAARSVVDVLLVVNNFAPSDEPPALAELRALPISVIAVPQLPLKHGEVKPIAARVLGARQAAPGLIIHLDADARVPHATELVDWYIAQYRRGAMVAATGVGFVDLPPGLSIRARVFAHSVARWVKRRVFGTAVTRGSNYATDRGLFLDAYDRGMIADELNVGPAMVALGAHYAYSSAPRLKVLTSGRRFRPGWGRLLRYLRYRLAYNLRNLPVDEAAASRTRRWEDPSDRWG